MNLALAFTGALLKGFALRNIVGRNPQNQIGIIKKNDILRPA
jgi:hypothetical protein